MPRIFSMGSYNAFYRNAVKVFTTVDLAQYRMRTTSGSSLYRYVGYRNSMPQAANAGKTLWLDARKDTGNRWTGWGQAEGDSAQGLYFSNEYLDQDQPFPELDHYLDKNADPDALIAYFKYRPNEKPQLLTASAGELRSMFLFTTDKDLRGLDLKLYRAPGQTNPLLEAILQEVRTNNPEVLHPADTLASLYTSENADFCRAVGNACLGSVDGIDYFETLSVRDLKSANRVLRAVPATPLEFLDPQGRATFFVNADKVGQGVYTVSDMVYNATFEDVDADLPIDLPTKSQFRDTLIAVSGQLCDDMVEQYQALIVDAPPNPVTERVGQQLLEVRTSLAQRDFQQALGKIADVQGSIQKLDLGNNRGFQAGEVQALKMSQSVMGSLAEMATSIDLARTEIDERHDIDPGDVDISDPDLDLLDPAKANEPVQH